jgi:hypothetical protein
MGISSRDADEAMAVQEAEAGRAALEQELAPHAPTQAEIDAIIAGRAEALKNVMAFRRGEHTGGAELYALDRALFEQPVSVLLLRRALDQ